ncbi:copper amine oxidase N-terminal domain-containing protein [Paenibacillus cremeus]|uniref:Copper amine oxidase N-terminal domain-containing protein n=1 Tax=Paenibacillus cremeus TaxID=2163881 RepID=A0A559K8V5_9BACL|nr:copper amine oxidase N-terminal domain-containing protein [Paenibacillus cremeus]TVY08523.1 copper amine oxidase N-terminal domain-containing protein [Paenibacillus cremeus]
MKVMKRWNAVLCGLLVLVLLVVAGCQPVSGFDVNKLLNNSVAVKSAEGKRTVTLELTPDAQSATADQQKLFDLFGKVKLEVYASKMQDPQHASMRGAVEYAKGRIPFELTLADQVYTIRIEGAKKPIVIKGAAAWNPNPNPMVPVTKGLQEQLDQMSKRAVDAAPAMASFFINNFPNPNTISVTGVTESVNGELMPLQKLHAEIYGSEWIGLVKGFLTNVLADDKGMKDFLGQLYDLYIPVIMEAMKGVDEGMQKQGVQPKDDENSITNTTMPYLKNKTLAVEFAYTFLKSTLQKYLDNYDKNVADFTATANGKELLNDNQYLKMDIYADQDLLPRKSTIELLLTNPESDHNDGLKSIKLTSTSEVWSVNKPVTVDTINTSNGVIDLAGESGNLTMSKFIGALEPNSQLYKLLKEDLELTKKEVTLLMGQPDPYSFSTRPFNDQGVVMVPARFVSEKLEAEVKWLADTKQVRITDPVSGTVILLTIDSPEASVNGKAVTMEKPAVLVHGSTFVPVRFVAESLGAKVSWDETLQAVKITRE